MRIPASILAVLMIGGCTQPAATVEQKGHEYFGRDGGRAIARAATPASPTSGAAISSRYNAPIQYNNSTVSQTPVNAVSTKELAPIPVTKKTSALETAPVTTKAEASWAPRPSNKTSEFILPVAAKMVSGYGKAGKTHKGDGLVFAGVHGEPVYASADGTVAFASDELKSYGNMVIIKHDRNMNTSYAHLSRMVVAKGTEVKQGQIIGYLGQPEMQFTMREGTEPVDPNLYLSKHVASN